MQPVHRPNNSTIQLLCLRALILVSAVPLLTFSSSGAASIATINSDQVLVIDGRKIFPIGFTSPPPPEGKTPEGRNGIEELADAGATFLRTGAHWDAEGLKREQEYMDAAARYGLYCLPYLREYSRVK